MDPEHIQSIAMRDQLWSSLRLLMPEIERLAAGEFSGTDRERQLLLLIARIVVAEMKFRAEDAAGEAGPAE